MLLGPVESPSNNLELSSAPTRHDMTRPEWMASAEFLAYLSCQSTRDIEEAAVNAIAECDCNPRTPSLLNDEYYR